MPPISQLLQSTTNRLVMVNVAIYIVFEALFAGQRSGFELFYWENPEFQFWQPLSYMFLHGSLAHLAFNMLALWSFGRVLERVWGQQKFLIYYLVCGLGAGLIHLVVTYFQLSALYTDLLAAGLSEGQIESVLQTGREASNLQSALRDTIGQYYILYHSPTIGASGAVYGVLVAFALLFPNFKVILIFLPIPVAAKYFVPVLLLIDLSAGITGISIFGQNIAHFAHIGGALVGFLLIQFWLRQSRQ